MPALASVIDVRAPAFAANRARMEERLKAVRDIEDRVRANSQSRETTFRKRGQLLPRERIAQLLDPGAPFLEIATLAGYKMHDDDGESGASGGGSIIGIGIVAGRRCMILANDSAIKGGTIAPMGLKKTLRAHQIAMENKLPLVHLVESGGANLLYQAEIFVDGGRTFANQARLSAAGIPQIAVVHGSSTAGGAYLPGMSDYVVVVRGRSKIFLAGPPLVKSAIGEEASDEELGGAELHAGTTGLGEYLVDDDTEAVLMARAILDKLKWDLATQLDDENPPLLDREELLGIVPTDDREPFDMREIIARIVDASDFLAFKEGYGAETICGHARIGGYIIGILANNGPIQPDGSTKAAQFIQLCDQSGTPLVFLQNTTGYMVGTAAERAGAIKHGSKMIQAVANARVPKLTIVCGGSFGAGNYGMCGRGFDPRFIFAWPSARTAVMGADQATGVMEIITRAKSARAGQEVDEKKLARMVAGMKAQLEAEATAIYGSARLWDDGIIDPRDTRRVLALCLQICAEGDARQLRGNTFGIARM